MDIQICKMTDKRMNGWADPYVGIFNVTLPADAVFADSDEFLEKNEKFKKI